MGKHSTKTVTASNELVPWLAADGPLAYSPENPPSRDYYFQYGWVLPGVLNTETGSKPHQYFAAWRKDEAKEIFAFWNDARRGKGVPIWIKNGRIAAGEVTAPLAVYRHESRSFRQRHYMFIQHGSYQHVASGDQPEIDSGIVYLYRGIQEAKKFRYRRFDPGFQGPADRRAWLAYLRTHAEILSDSVTSFNSIHDRTKRCETGHINDSSWVSDEIAKRNGLDVCDGGFAEELWRSHQQCFTLERWVAEGKFEPNHVVAKTPLSNIRITTFFAGEVEAKIIDPNQLAMVKSVGCEWE